MEQHSLAHEIFRIAEPLVRSLGLVIWGIEYIPSGRALLRIYIDGPDGPGGAGPGIDQCAHISRHVGLALEAEDLIPNAYVLELSSPGLERPFFELAQLAPYVGERVALKLHSAPPELPDRKHLRGTLLAVGDRDLRLLAHDAPEGTHVSIAWDAVRKAALAPELPFSNTEKPGKRSVPKADATSKKALAASRAGREQSPGLEADR